MSTPLSLNRLPALSVCAALLFAPAISAAQDAGAERNLAALVEPLWSDLDSNQRSVLEPFAEQWNAWPTEEKRVWVALADRFPGLSEKAKSKAIVRIREWAALTPEQRQVARTNYRLARELDRDARMAEWRRYSNMTPEQQKILRANGTISTTATRGTVRSGLASDAAQPLAAPPQLLQTRE